MQRILAALLIVFGLASAALAQAPVFSIRTISGSGAAVTTAQVGTLIWTGTAPASWAVTLPSNPTSGSIVSLATDTTLTTLVTVTASSGDTIVAAFAAQTLTANTTAISWQFYGPTRTWYRIE